MAETRNACSWQPKDVTLVTGEVVKSDSAEWKDECEARHILNMATKADRLELLDKIEKKRGPAARRELEIRILKLWEVNKTKRGEAA